MADHVSAIDRINDLAVGQHRDDDIDSGDGIADIGKRHAAIFLGLCQRRFGEIERMNLMPRLDEIGSHAAAHVAKTNKCDFHSGLHCSLAGKGAKIVSIVVSEMSSAQAGFQRGALSLSTITARTLNEIGIGDYAATDCIFHAHLVREIGHCRAAPQLLQRDLAGERRFCSKNL